MALPSGAVRPQDLVAYCQFTQLHFLSPASHRRSLAPSFWQMQPFLRLVASRVLLPQLSPFLLSRGPVTHSFEPLTFPFLASPFALPALSSFADLGSFLRLVTPPTALSVFVLSPINGVLVR